MSGLTLSSVERLLAKLPQGILLTTLPSHPSLLRTPWNIWGILVLSSLLALTPLHQAAKLSTALYEPRYLLALRDIYRTALKGRSFLKRMLQFQHITSGSRSCHYCRILTCMSTGYLSDPMDLASSCHLSSAMQLLFGNGPKREGRYTCLFLPAVSPSFPSSGCAKLVRHFVYLFMLSRGRMN